MRKTVCTATIFAAMVGGLGASLVIQVPMYLWWSENMSRDEYRCPLLLALSMNIIVPFLIGLLGLLFLMLIWESASAICAKLRGEKAQQ